MIVQNPILRGFNPDPSIIRVGDDYYIATSTFEWFPGVQIHHSRDLVHWRLLTRPLNRVSQLDMKGNPDSCGVWAPCLSWDKGTFYLIYSNVRSFDGVWKDSHNYLVTAKDILGEWSDPVFLGSRGFDGSLYHDDDGKKWYTSMIVDHRKSKFFGGIVLQEFDPDSCQLTGEMYHIFEGSSLGYTEGPHIFKKDGYYYLLTAEGGTEYGHAASMARSRKITGPYTLHPGNPFITSRYQPQAPLQKAGHADLVQDKDGEWFAVFLIGRPILGRCILGRETAIEKVCWPENEWPRLSHNSPVPRVNVKIDTGAFREKNRETAFFDDFDQPVLNIHFQSLRVPVTENWLSLRENPGYLRIYGQESLSSLHHQSLIARRIQHFTIEASTIIRFEPGSYQQMAGMILYYNTSHFHYLHITTDTTGNKKLLNIITSDRHVISEPMVKEVELSGNSSILLKAALFNNQLQFYYALQDKEWMAAGPVLDASILSDDYVRDENNRYRPAFTGAFIGLCCQDLSGNRQYADFDWFSYKEIHEEAKL